jgi:epoxyqueuosine reductase
MLATPDRKALTERIKGRALALGFTGVGIVEAGPALTHGVYEEWLAAGNAGAMDYLQRHAVPKSDPRELLPNARSYLIVSFNYLVSEPETPPGLRGRVARYAWGDDYHEILRERLERLATEIVEEAKQPVQSRIFVDSSPVMEREWAARAGLGWIGKNGNLIHWQHGSWLFLGGMLLDLGLEPDVPQGRALESASVQESTETILDLLRAQESCGACRICIDACPTGALIADKTLDARRCIAYLTNELKGPIPRELRADIGGWVYGCDICQDVCPWNRRAPESPEPALRATADQAHPKLTELLAANDTDFRARFSRTAVLRAKRRGLARNAAIVLGNRFAEAETTGRASSPEDRQSALAVLIPALADPEPVVRDAAAWAVARAGLFEASAAVEDALANETDADVKGELANALDALKEGTGADAGAT